jgi:phosphate transport system permease protein
MVLLLVASLIAILTTLGIFLSLLWESLRFFQQVPPDFLFGTHWSPQVIDAADPGQVARRGAVVLGDLLHRRGDRDDRRDPVRADERDLPHPICRADGAQMDEADPRDARGRADRGLWLFRRADRGAGGARSRGDLGMPFASSESALAAGLVMGVMIIPFVSSMADDSIAAVPTAMRDGSLAMGATTSETISKVLIPAALAGRGRGRAARGLRAIGETMIVVMAASGAANITLNPFESATTVTKQIVDLLTGEAEFDSPKTLAAFALG